MSDKLKRDFHELHWQVYHGLRQYPMAFLYTNVTMFCTGMAAGVVGCFVIDWLKGRP